MEWNIMECNGMCLFGFGWWRPMELSESPVLGREYSVGKSGAWPKIFGLKLGVSRKIFGWELEKVWKIFGLKLEKYWISLGL
jgi:hypothetical protein